jgi:hypothetical protein
MKMQIFIILDKANPDTVKYKRLKLGGGQANDRLSDYSAVVAEATEDKA